MLPCIVGQWHSGLLQQTMQLVYGDASQYDTYFIERCNENNIFRNMHELYLYPSLNWLINNARIGLAPVWRQTITRNNTELLLIGLIWAKLRESLIKIR